MNPIINAPRIVFMGTPEFAVASLDAIIESGYTVVGVITAPDKPSGRGLKTSLSAVKQYALTHNLPLLQPTNLKDPTFLAELQALQADLQIVVAFRKLPHEVFEMPRLGTFNLHASLLPDYRGAAPINWAIINGEKQSGVTTFFLNEQIDEGQILHQQSIPIPPEETAGSLHDKLMLIGSKLVVQTIGDILLNTVTPKAQELHGQALKSAPKIYRETCRIDWSKPGKEILQLIRGLNPFPTAFTELPSTKADKTLALKIFDAHFVPKEHAFPLASAQSDGKTFFRIATPDGFLYLDSIQQAGKKRMTTPEYLRGVDLELFTTKED